MYKINSKTDEPIGPNHMTPNEGLWPVVFEKIVKEKMSILKMADSLKLRLMKMSIGESVW